MTSYTVSQLLFGAGGPKTITLTVVFSCTMRQHCAIHMPQDISSVSAELG